MLVFRDGDGYRWRGFCVIDISVGISVGYERADVRVRREIVCVATMELLPLIVAVVAGLALVALFMRRQANAYAGHVAQLQPKKKVKPEFRCVLGHRMRVCGCARMGSMHDTFAPMQASLLTHAALSPMAMPPHCMELPLSAWHWCPSGGARTVTVTVCF